MNATIIYHCGVMEAIKPFYRALADCGVRVSVIVPRKVIVDPIYTTRNCLTVSPEDQPAGYKLIPIDLIDFRYYNLGFHLAQLYHAIKTSEPDIIHVFNEYHCFPVTQVIFIRNRFLKKKVPVAIYGFQNIDYLKLKNRTPGDFLKTMMRGVIVRYNLKHLDGITAASEEALWLLKKRSPNISAKKIFWGIDTAVFFPQEKEHSRRKLMLPPEGVIIGYFGRMVQEKGIECLLKAAARLKNVYLLLIGEGPHSGKIKQMARELLLPDRILYKPGVPRDQLNDYYNSLDCFVLPSQTTPMWKEQYGRVLVEAMLCGIPVVGSNSGAIAEIIQGYPRQRIFQEGDDRDLAECIAELLNKKSVAAGPFPLEKFSMENFAREHAEFYHSLITSL